MKVVGLTGGIGSGKTTVSEMFKSFGVPVYIADIEAKNLMNNSKIIRQKLIKEFGNDAYTETGINKEYIASRVFKDKTALQLLNGIVHPKVASHFAKWLKNQTSPYVIKEAAIIFENHMEDQYDYIITVTADRDERIKRLLKRDDGSKKRILSIMENQMSDEEKVKKSDFVIKNQDLIETQKAVLKIHRILMKDCVK